MTRYSTTAMSAVTPISMAWLTMRGRPLDGWGVSMDGSEERRVGKECRSLCDWSSDVCSSDLDDEVQHDRDERRDADLDGLADDARAAAGRLGRLDGRIGRASCRERV